MSMYARLQKYQVTALIKKIRTKIPDVILRTTFITGLPGETDGEFEELYQFAKKWKFDRFGVFSYAPEPGTPAAEMPDQIPVEIADARAKKLLNAQISRMKRQQKKLVGTTVKAIFDYVDEESGWGIARSASDAPDIDSVIYFEPDEIHLPGDFITLEINGAAGTDLTAVIVQ